MLRGWMAYSAMAFAWTGAVVVGSAVTVSTSGVEDGVCKAQYFWKSTAARKAYGIWYFVSYYVVILLILLPRVGLEIGRIIQPRFLAECRLSRLNQG